MKSDNSGALITREEPAAIRRPLIPQHHSEARCSDLYVTLCATVCRVVHETGVATGVGACAM